MHALVSGVGFICCVALIYSLALCDAWDCAGLSLVVGLVLYISSINDEVMNRPREPEQFFNYHYGWSFAFAASSFLLKEVSCCVESRLLAPSLPSLFTPSPLLKCSTSVHPINDEPKHVYPDPPPTHHPPFFYQPSTSYTLNSSVPSITSCLSKAAALFPP